MFGLITIKSCLVIEDEVVLILGGGKPVKFCEHDLVVFSAGMKCKWDVHNAIRKYYSFRNKICMYL